MRDLEIYELAVKKYFEPIAQRIALPLVKVKDGIFEAYSPYYILRLRLDNGHARGMNVILRDASHRVFNERAPHIQLGIGCFIEFAGEKLDDYFNLVDTDEDFIKRAQLLAKATERYAVPYLLGQGKNFEAIQEIYRKRGKEAAKEWENFKFPSFVKKGWVTPSTPTARATLYNAKFLRNLTGEREDQFKKAFIIRFREDLSIKCAYLVEVEKDDGNKVPALCIKAPYADQNAVTAGVKEVYSRFYGPEDHLDVIFLTPRQEIEMEGACVPFYDIQDEAHHLVTNGKPGLLSTMTARVAESCLGDKPFLEAARREPQGPTDSGWTFYSHSGAQDDPAKTETWTLLQVFKKDPSFLRWVDAPIGTALWRTDARFEWRDLAEKPQPGTFRLPPADGPGPFAANEPPKRFGDESGSKEDGAK